MLKRRLQGGRRLGASQLSDKDSARRTHQTRKGGSARHSRLAFGGQAHTKGRREGQYFTPTQAADLNCVLHSTSLWQRGGWRGVLWSHAPPSRPWQCTFGPRDPHLSQQGHWPDPLPIHPSLPRLSLPHPSGSPVGILLCNPTERPRLFCPHCDPVVSHSCPVQTAGRGRGGEYRSPSG